MDETPEQWLEDLFEFEFCGECGGDAVDHEVCVVPGMGTYFARCLRGWEAPDDGDHAMMESMHEHHFLNGDPARR